MSDFDFRDARMTDARFRVVDLSGARFDQVDLIGVVMRGVTMVDVDISGEIHNVTVNGVDIGPLVEAELDRRDPDRVKMRPADLDGFREAWAIRDRLWAGTVERARGLDPDLLHESVDDEWSFIQTLRHLVFATDVWVRRAIQGHPSPWHPLGLPFDEMTPAPGIPWDRAIRPSLDEVLALRADRAAAVRQVLDDLTEEGLDAPTDPANAPSWAGPVAHPVRKCLQIVLNEEWEHRLYAERDLDVLVSRRASRGASAARG